MKENSNTEDILEKDRATPEASGIIPLDVATPRAGMPSQAKDETPIYIRIWKRVTVEQFYNEYARSTVPNSDMDISAFIKKDSPSYGRSGGFNNKPTRCWYGDLDENGAKIWIDQ